MQSYQHILLATDFTEFSGRAAQRVRQLAADSGTKVTLFHVIEEPVPYMGDDLEPLLIDPQLDDELKVLAERMMADFSRNNGFENARIEIDWGSPKLVLTDWARENDVDLIVVGSHGRHGLARLLGSVSTGVMHHAHCDVLVVK